MTQYNDIKTSTIAIIGLIGAIATFLIVILLMVLYQDERARQDHVKRIGQPFVERDDLTARQQARLNEAKWLKEVTENGTTRPVHAIPIDRAMELVVSDYTSRPRKR